MNQSTGLIGVLGNISLRWRFVLIFMGSWGLVAAGIVVGELYRLYPCPLCIFQRVLYLVVGLCALLAALAPERALWRWAFAGLGLLAAAAGLATAVYQTWMQAFPDNFLACGFGEPNLIERFVDWLGAQWEYMFLATGLCTSRDWTFLGLSMANWSVPCFLTFGGMLAWAGWGRVGRSA